MHHYPQISVVQSFKLKPKERFAGDSCLWFGGLGAGNRSFRGGRVSSSHQGTTSLADSAPHNIIYIAQPDVDDFLR